MWTAVSPLENGGETHGNGWREPGPLLRLQGSATRPTQLNSWLGRVVLLTKSARLKKITGPEAEGQPRCQQADTFAAKGLACSPRSRCPYFARAQACKKFILVGLAPATLLNVFLFG